MIDHLPWCWYFCSPWKTFPSTVDLRPLSGRECCQKPIGRLGPTTSWNNRKRKSVKVISNTGRFVTTIFSATEGYNIVATFRKAATLFQHLNPVLRQKSSLQMVSCNITFRKSISHFQLARKTGVLFSKVPVLTFQGSISRKTRNFSGPKNCFMFAVLAFKIKV